LLNDKEEKIDCKSQVQETSKEKKTKEKTKSKESKKGNHSKSLFSPTLLTI